MAIKRGFERGHAEGRAESKAELLARILRRRFGELPGWTEQGLAQTTAAQLEGWADQVLDAAPLEAVFD